MVKQSSRKVYFTTFLTCLINFNVIFYIFPCMYFYLLFCTCCVVLLFILRRKTSFVLLNIDVVVVVVSSCRSVSHLVRLLVNQLDSCISLFNVNLSGRYSRGRVRWCKTQCVIMLMILRKQLHKYIISSIFHFFAFNYVILISWWWLKRAIKIHNKGWKSLNTHSKWFIFNCLFKIAISQRILTIKIKKKCLPA